MVDIDFLKKYIPEELIEYATKFEIWEEFMESDSELIILILKSKALDTDEEKQNWLNLLPLMTEDQVVKLREILVKEVKKLEEIENKYDTKRKDLKKKYLMRWQKIGYLEKVQEVKEKEEMMKSKEEDEAENLLNSI